MFGEIISVHLYFTDGCQNAPSRFILFVKTYKLVINRCFCRYYCAVRSSGNIVQNHFHVVFCLNCGIFSVRRFGHKFRFLQCDIRIDFLLISPAGINIKLAVWGLNILCKNLACFLCDCPRNRCRIGLILQIVEIKAYIIVLQKKRFTAVKGKCFVLLGRRKNIHRQRANYDAK